MRYYFENNEDLKNLIAITIIVLVGFLIVFAYLYRNMQISLLDYEIQFLRRKEKTIFLEVENLRFQISKYSSTERIEKLFQKNYGYLPILYTEKIYSIQLPQPLLKKEFMSDE